MRTAPHDNAAMLRKKAKTDDDHKLPDTQNFFNTLQDATVTPTPLPVRKFKGNGVTS